MGLIEIGDEVPLGDIARRIFGRQPTTVDTSSEVDAPVDFSKGRFGFEEEAQIRAERDVQAHAERA
jgi:hypothetical protein